MVRRRGSMVRLRDAAPSAREHAQLSLLTMFLTDTPLHEKSSIRILGLLGTWTLSVALFCIQLCLLSGMSYSSFDSSKKERDVVSLPYIYGVATIYGIVLCRLGFLDV